LCLIFFLIIAVILSPDNIFPQTLDNSDAALQNCFKLLKDSFVQEDAEKLTKILPAYYKIELRLGLLSPDSGFYSPSQVFYIWKNHFQENNTLDFELRREEISFIGPKDIILQARWLLRRKDSLKIRGLSLYFSLYRQNHHWVIRKIRVSQLSA